MGEVIALARLAWSEVPREAIHDKRLYMKRVHYLDVSTLTEIVAVPIIAVRDDSFRLVISDGTKRVELEPPYPVVRAGGRVALIVLPH